MCSYHLVRWIPIPEAQLRQRETAVASDPTQVRSILAPARARVVRIAEVLQGEVAPQLC